jgi:preprotein translocase subunit SecD
MSKKKGPAKKKEQAIPRPEKPGQVPPRTEKPVTWGELLRDWRVALLLVLVFLSVIAIYPHVENGKLTTALQFGLDLQGGSWIQMGFGAEVVGYETTGTAGDLVTSLRDRLETQVSDLGNGRIEIQKYYSREDLAVIFSGLNATLTSYDEGVTRNTADTVKRILEEKINTLGTRDARVNLLTPVGSSVVHYVRVEMAGVNMQTAREIVTRQGKFEIRIQTTGNETEHVLFGDVITSVGVPTKESPGKEIWGVSFTLSEEGANAFQDACIRSGAVTDPANHYLSMILDNRTVYSAPLSADLAKNLKTQPTRQLYATTGEGTAGLNQAQQLEIHLRAGALPVEVKVVGSGSVSAPLGERYMWACMVAGLFAILTVGLVIYYRYREPLIVLPMMGTNIAEVVILLGVARFIQQLDLASIAGLIAVLGTGVDQLVMITDEVLHEGKVPSPSLYMKRLARAVAIIVVAAGTVVIAMLPLILMDLSTLKGFALITIIGVLVGVLVTRPAYGRIIMAILSR